MITDKQLEDVAKVVRASRTDERAEYPPYIHSLAKAYLDAPTAERMIIEKAWEPIIKKNESLSAILGDPQTAGWMAVINGGRYSPAKR